MRLVSYFSLGSITFGAMHTVNLFRAWKIETEHLFFSRANMNANKLT